MALPFALNHINLWLLRDEMDTPTGKVQGWSIVDCCIHRDEAKTQWEQIFANELQGLPVLRVIVTHCTPTMWVWLTGCASAGTRRCG